MEHRWNEIDRGKPKYSGGKTCPSAILSATNPTWTDPGWNPGLRDERPATNRLSHGTVSDIHVTCNVYCKVMFRLIDCTMLRCVRHTGRCVSDTQDAVSNTNSNTVSRLLSVASRTPRQVAERLKCESDLPPPFIAGVKKG
jgi:hypothetical protein